MPASLEDVLKHSTVSRARVAFTSMSHAACRLESRGPEATVTSDLDVMVELDEHREIGDLNPARLKLYMNDLLQWRRDSGISRTLKRCLRDSILRDAIHAFLPESAQRLRDIIDNIDDDRASHIATRLLRFQTDLGRLRRRAVL